MTTTRLFCLSVGLLTLLTTAPLRAADDAAWFDTHTPELIRLYQHLHSHPELSYHENETASRVAAELRKAGARVTENVGGTGVVGVMTNGNGPTVLVRCDLDALPVTEATGLPYASRVQTKNDAGDSVGVMHACGHDVHMTSLVGTARWLADHKPLWNGTVVFVAQPAEERIGGAKEMLADGLYERFPKPDYALALHVAHDLRTGQVGYCSGPALASSTSVDVYVKGRGGHGAMPHNTVDPITLAALLVLDFQTIVSREISPIEPAVLTVGSIQGGSKHNIIPDDVHLQLTLRAYSESVRTQLIEGIRRRAEGLAQAHRAPRPVVEVGESTPATINSPSLIEAVLPAFSEALGEENVIKVEPTMGAEDFGLFSQGGVPIFLFRLGTIPPDRVQQSLDGGEPLPSLHSALYQPDPEASLHTGIRAMTAAVVKLLPPQQASIKES